MGIRNDYFVSSHSLTVLDIVICMRSEPRRASGEELGWGSLFTIDVAGLGNL